MENEFNLRIHTSIICISETNRAYAKQTIIEEIQTTIDRLDDHTTLRAVIYINPKLNHKINNFNKYFDKIHKKFSDIILFANVIPGNKDELTFEQMQNIINDLHSGDDEILEKIKNEN